MSHAYLLSMVAKATSKNDGHADRSPVHLEALSLFRCIELFHHLRGWNDGQTDQTAFLSLRCFLDLSIPLQHNCSIVTPLKSMNVSWKFTLISIITRSLHTHKHTEPAPTGRKETARLSVAVRVGGSRLTAVKSFFFLLFLSLL